MPNEFKLAAAEVKSGFDKAPKPPKFPTIDAKLLVNPERLFEFGTGPKRLELGGAATGAGTG
jgi:hypothetical protein